ncbi:pyroglutamyl-peptidase I [Firmicutes bacterium M10-2]|nr:pyroglutamyl-peptidase I [Firmicutes bacterium M10-2]
MKLLITGFEPFGNESINPAYEAVKLLSDTIGNVHLVKLEIPTEFMRAGMVLKDAIDQFHPDVVVCIGQAGGRSAITPEKVAINLMDARIPDNAGYQPFDKPIREDGETAYFSSLPVKAMVQAIRDAKIPSFLSYSAGTYVCNCLMYELLYLIDHFYPTIKGGFIHVPYMTEQAVDKPNGMPFMDLKTIVHGLEKAIEAIAEHEEDIQIHLGETH